MTISYLNLFFNVFADCFYADEKFLEGGSDKDVKIEIVGSTVNCIDRCIEMKKECSYWSVSKKQDNNNPILEENVKSSSESEPGESTSPASLATAARPEGERPPSETGARPKTTAGVCLTEDQVLLQADILISN